MADFIFDLEKSRAAARKHLECGAVTATYAADRTQLIDMLASALATEWICVLRYTQHYLAAAGINAAPVADHFLEHAEEERSHAMRLAKRIRQLGGVPTLDPSNMAAASHSEYKECSSLSEMIQENLVAERIAIDSYKAMIEYVGERDPTTKHLLEDILATEEKHAEEMADLLTTYEPASKLH